MFSPMNSKLSRRHFIRDLVSASLIANPVLKKLASGAESPLNSSQNAIKICVFSKHLQWLDYEGMAESAAKVGFDGIDLTVRPGGHVLPERVEEDLPRAAEAIKKAGLELPMMTTNITNAGDETSLKVLKTASALGVRYYRMGYYGYDEKIDVTEKLNNLKPQVSALARVNEQFKIHGAYQNHAGNNRVGAPLWDIWELVKNENPLWLGIQYDIRHATVEGGQTWPLNLRLIASHVKSIVIKDFYWAKAKNGWRLQNCPLGQGMVDFKKYFGMLKQFGFSGPISLHYEYPLGGAEHGKHDPKLEPQKILHSMRIDVKRLRDWLSEAGLS